MKVLIIIPAYNEQDNIANVVNNLQTNYPQYDYLIINDCSRDKTKEICIENNFRYISLPTNLGIGGGVQAGYIYAVEHNYDVTVQYDGDGQHDARYIASMIENIQKNHTDMVIGSRFIKKEGFQSSGMRRFGIKFISMIIKMCCGIRIMDTTSGFRACSKKMTEYFSQNYAQDYPEPEAIVAAVLNGFKVEEIPVEMHERQGGVSSINLKRSIYYMIKVTLALLINRISIKKKGKCNIYEHEA